MTSPALSEKNKPTAWSEDAVRVVEHIRSRLAERPALVLIGGLEAENVSGVVASEVAQALAALSDEKVLLVDLCGKSAVENFPITPLAERLDAATANAPALQSAIHFLTTARSKYPVIILHSFPFSRQESYALITRADFSVVVLTKGQSKSSALAQLRSQTAAIGKKELGVILAS